MKKLMLLVWVATMYVAAQAQAVIDHATHNASFHYGMVDAKGRWIIQPIYEEAAWYDFIQVGVIGQRGKLKGAVDRHGRTLLPMAYKQINGCKRGQSLIVAQQQGDSLRWGVLIPIQEDGKASTTRQLVPLEYSTLTFSRRDTMYRATRPDGQVVWIDLEGNINADYQPVQMADDSYPHLRAAQEAKPENDEDISKHNQELQEEELDLTL